MRYLIAVVVLLMCVPAWAERDIDTIIIHHTASKDVSAYVIDQWHRERGWSGIGYHYVIREGGRVETGRDINKVGAHAKGRNTGSIGIALTGYDDFTEAQKTSLRMLVKELRTKYNINSIERHHEECPGKGINIESIANED